MAILQCHNEQAREEFSCNATNGVLVAPLQHGASYHVVLLATNGAGLSTRTVSRSFVVDLFSNIEVRRCWEPTFILAVYPKGQSLTHYR